MGGLDLHRRGRRVVSISDFVEMCEVIALWIGGGLLVHVLYGIMMERKE